MATRSEPATAASVTSTARSAPIASALRSDSIAFSGPTETTTTSPPRASLMRSASSTAFTSVALSAPSPVRSSRFVAGSMRRVAVASGTCFTQTAIFIARDSSHRAESQVAVVVDRSRSAHAADPVPA